MKVGSLVYTTDQGLSILAKSFHDNKVVTDVMVVRHGSRKEHDEWYPDSKRIYSLSSQEELEHIYTFCKSMDVMLFFETPFIWQLIPYCQKHNIKTALMVMYECMPHTLPYLPDLYLCPSLLDKQYYPQRNSIYLPIPVDVRWKERTTVKTFVHNAGHGGLKGRNGTAEFLHALRHIKQPINVILRSQEPIPNIDTFFQRDTLHGNVQKLDVRVGNFDYENLYQEGEVFVFPEKFNGLSLPLQEAYASGMVVLATDRYPNNTYIPQAGLIPTIGHITNRISSRCNTYNEAVIQSEDIAACMDSWYNKDVSQYSQYAKEWAQLMSWQVLKPRYTQVLTDLIQSKYK